ncbi:MAG: hypothetical protein FD176_2279 [Rhodospirillaceae bacterium]|nr:MAG: hypothetical protein FD176_2279 [Rhodospirillaceae bacterium]TNC95597.1 MAG: hypothetical protein FD119_2225 [Stygiobacter sp.]
MPHVADSLHAPLLVRAVHLADRMGMHWADYLYLLETVQRYLSGQDKGAPRS